MQQANGIAGDIDIAFIIISFKLFNQYFQAGLDFTDITILKREIDTLLGGEVETFQPTTQLPLLPDEELGAMAKARKGRRR